VNGIGITAVQRRKNRSMSREESRSQIAWRRAGFAQEAKPFARAV